MTAIQCRQVRRAPARGAGGVRRNTPPHRSVAGLTAVLATQITFLGEARAEHEGWNFVYMNFAYVYMNFSYVYMNFAII